ncbi:MAG TPA: Rpn family recombination-promoting nuclease/putative transposase [Gammaproteobacteria bacterium]|nr:Rpn family recombination-promoting nuclease/putative transposase [Gammaproteobacteria bacterium]
MPRYLDPKTDIVFKKIFGQNPKILKSFLNAVLPLPAGGLIVSLEYLANEQVPVIPAFKFTVVDVKCTDEQGRVFIVEMQIQWAASFKQRLLFNASRAYVHQLEKGENYELLKPVYGLGLINTSFDPDEDHWYHHYKIVNVEKPQVEIKDLQLIFIELPKFRAKNYREKKLQVLWLRFISELNEKVNQVPPELLEVAEIKQALELAEEAAYTPVELDDYNRYWDAVSVEKTLISDALRRGEAMGRAEGVHASHQLLARKWLSKGMTLEEIAKLLDLSLDEVAALLN